MTINGRFLAGLASQIIATVDAAVVARVVKPTHFANAHSFRPIKTLYVPAVPRLIKPAHFDQVHTFNPIKVTTAAGGGGEEGEFDVTPRRYVRLFLEKQSANAFALDEIEFRAVSGGPSVATGGTAIESAAGHFGSEAPANAFDGSTSKWSANSGAEGEWIGYDFGDGNEQDIVEVAIKSYTSEQGQTPHIFTVERGNDGINWFPSWHVQTTPDWGAAETRVFTRPDQP